ncbi:hypothetical protein [Arthrobacter sp. AL12]|uniref:sunset domain-containing protein n=1 Tax=Arthrobacter sp. AL12 TaxID=3042241 RepID=UPI00249AA6D5|nr:hypothetical protein [Arthrobacter sp. AL12]MDI3211869.1 hypothetical protein [Arthrobacter sp. AL12]
MDWIIWLVVIVAIVAIVWWLLNRNSSRSSSSSAKSGTAATHDSTPPHLHDVDHDASHRGALSGGGSAASASAAGFNQAEPEAGAEPEPDASATAEDAAAAEAHAKRRAAATAASAAEPGATAASAAEPGAEDASTAEPGTVAASGAGAAHAPAGEVSPAGTSPTQSAEWETQWSETPPAEQHAAVHPAAGHHEPVQGAGPGAHVTEATAATANVPVHHPEYTEPHAATLPGAESAAAETEAEAGVDTRPERGASVKVPPPVQEQERAPAQAPAEPGPAQAETRQAAMSSAASETAVGHAAEPAGHLAVDQPYGEGSAAPAPDGSGPEGFTVKGNASSMVYYDETSPAFEETRAEVWFLSAAHAEAAGFRPPRRSRQ